MLLSDFSIVEHQKFSSPLILIQILANKDASPFLCCFVVVVMVVVAIAMLVEIVWIYIDHHCYLVYYLLVEIG